MTNNKQSSVEWLDNELASLHFDYLTGRIDNKDFNERHEAIIKQAKAMHKEEIENAHLEGQCDETEGYPLEIARKFYNETYGGNK